MFVSSQRASDVGGDDAGGAEGSHSVPESSIQFDFLLRFVAIEDESSCRRSG
jgi:hypothetical protein